MMDIIMGSVFLGGAVILIVWAARSGQLWGSRAGSLGLTFWGVLKMIAMPITVPWNWSGRYMITRWIVVGALVIFGYSYLEKSQGDVRQVIQENRSDGSIFLRFELPEGHKRIEFLETFAVAIARREFIKPGSMPLVGFRFLGGTLYEYNVRGEGAMRDGLSWLTGVPLGDAGSIVKHYGEKVVATGMTGISAHSELEWDSPPYIIQVFAEPPGTPMNFGSEGNIYYRVVEKEKPKK